MNGLSSSDTPKKMAKVNDYLKTLEEKTRLENLIKLTPSQSDKPSECKFE